MRLDVSTLCVVGALTASCHGGPYAGLGSDVPLGDATVDDTAPLADTADASAPDTTHADVSSVDAAPDAEVDSGFVRDGRYPKVRSFKGLLPEGGTVGEVVAGGVGRVYFDLDWPSWEPSKRSPPCVAGGIAFEGHCYVPHPDFDAAVKAYTDAGVVVVVTLSAAPAWSHPTRSTSCKATALACAPDDVADFARFAGMLADRYGDFRTAADDHGRVSDFIVWPFQSQADFDVGAPPTGTTLRAYWMDVYASLFDATFDQIVAHTGEVHLLAALPRPFGADDFSAFPAVLSPTSLVEALLGKAGSRAWDLALEPRGFDPAFTPDTPLPTVTFGNLGRVLGTLRAQIGSAARPRLTLLYGYFDSAPAITDPATGTTGEAAQAEAICRAFRQALSTPGIDAWLYFPLMDTAPGAAAGQYMGLKDQTDTAKPSWTRFTTMDVPGTLDCGFELLPYVALTRRSNGTTRWVTTRMAASGYVAEGTPSGWRLAHDPAPDTRELFECVDLSKSKHFVSLDVKCEGQTPMGSLGFAWTANATGRVEIFRCDKADGTDSLVSGDATCEGYSLVTSLGWVLPK